MVSAETKRLANQSQGASDFPMAAETKAAWATSVITDASLMFKVVLYTFKTQLGNKEMLCVLIIERWEVKGKEGFTSSY